MRVGWQAPRGWVPVHYPTTGCYVSEAAKPSRFWLVRQINLGLRPTQFFRVDSGPIRLESILASRGTGTLGPLIPPLRPAVND